MPSVNRTIRLFVSSTFSDMKAERDALQREVFPKLKQLCLSRGLRFQAIDLRWGVPAKDAHGETANSREYCRQWRSLIAACWTTPKAGIRPGR